MRVLERLAGTTRLPTGGFTTETVVEKVVGLVKYMLGMPPADKPPDVVAKPEYTDTAPELTTEYQVPKSPTHGPIAAFRST